MNNKNDTLRGVIPALITPMTQAGDLDGDALGRQLEYMCGSGVNGFFIGGTTAEGAYLTTQEKRTVLAAAKQISDGRQYMCAACIQPSTRMVIADMEEMTKGEPDFIVAVAPYYFSSTVKGMIDHYTAIADESSLPVIMYDIPQQTHNPIPLEAICEMSGHPNIVGIKDSTGNFVRFSRMLWKVAMEPIAFIQGEDYLDSISFLFGADAIVTGLSNVLAEPYVRMYAASQKNDTAAVMEEQRIIHSLAEIIHAAGGSAIVAIKAALEHMGRCDRWLRTPDQNPSDEVVRAVGQIVDGLTSNS